MSTEDNKESAVQKPEEQQEKKQEQHEHHKHDKHHEIEKLKAEKDEMFARLQRVSAEFANFQKRSVKQISESVAYEKEHIIKSLLPILDNFEHTLTHGANAPEAAEMLKGVKIIYDQFLSILKTHECEQIKAVGEKFNPAVHQALTQRSEPDKGDMIVLEEFRKGYKMGEKVLRPATVIVNRKQAEQPKDEPKQDVDKQISEGGSDETS